MIINRSLATDFEEKLKEYSQHYISHDLTLSFYEEIPNLQKQYRSTKFYAEEAQTKL